MSQFNVGTYVLYKGLSHLVVETGELIKVVNLNSDNPNVKLNVKPTKLTVREDIPAAITLNCSGKTYMVTVDNVIISMLTLRVMKWATNDLSYKAIIDIANKLRNPVSKPPIGVMPRYLWNEQRLNDLVTATEEYREANFDVPQEWIEETYDLLRKSFDDDDDESAKYEWDESVD
jgi:hypothetical protein